VDVDEVLDEPRVVAARLEDLRALLTFVRDRFGSDKAAVVGWMHSPHPALGGLSPYAVFERGETDRLQDLVTRERGGIGPDAR
jgi:uncharacterized protein (DUF2384 family)